MTLSKRSKQAGLSSAAELTRITSVSKETLTNWMNNKPLLFDVLLLGAVQKKKDKERCHSVDTFRLNCLIFG